MSVEGRLSDLLLDWEEYNEQGNPVSPEELCRAHPELLDELKRRIQALQAMNPVVKTAAQNATTAGVEIGPEGTASPSWDDLLRQPPQVPGYDILNELGRGGMGVVYKARQRSLDRQVALKMLLAGPHASRDQLGRFRTEAEAVARLQHPNIVQIYEIGEHEHRPFFALEFVDGRNLDQALQGHPQPPEAAARLVETLARAMHYAHQRGIVHRDLKPGNVLLGLQCLVLSAETGRKRASLSAKHVALSTPKITDFGLAKLVGDQRGRTRAGAVLGTPSYMAPEQADGRNEDIGPATDIYALGAILYELLTGRPPFEGTTSWETINQVIADEPVPPSRLQPGVSRDLETICLKSLAKDPRKRYASAGDLADDLHSYLASEPIRARPIGILGRSLKWARRNKAIAALLAVSVVTALALLISGAIFTAQLYQANQEAKVEAEKSRKALVRLHVANGTHYMEDDDLFASLSWLAEALKMEPDPAIRQSQRERIAAILARCPRLHQMWFHKAGVTYVAFNRDGTRIVTAGDDNTAHIRDPFTGAELAEPLHHERSVLRASFSTDGRRVVTASADDTARVWDASTGKPITPSLRHEKSVRDAGFNPDGTRVVTGSDDGTAQVWDAATGKPLLDSPPKHKGPVVRATFSPDGKSILTASTDGTAQVWDADTGNPLLDPPLKHAGPLTYAAFSPDGKRIITSSEDRTARLWNMANSKEPLREFTHLGPVTHAEFNAAGNQIVTASADMTARIWDAANGQTLVPSIHHLSSVEWACFSPDGRLVATSSDDNTARLWDAATGRPVTPPLTHNGTVGQIAVSPDSRWLLTASDDNTARLYRSEARRPPVATLRHDGPIWQATYSADGLRIVTASADHTARLWDAVGGQPHGQPLKHKGEVFTARFKPDGTRVVTASADGTAQIWDVVTTQPVLATPLTHKGPVRCASFSSDGKHVVTGSEDRTARVWDAVTGQPVTPPLEHRGKVLDAVFSPDGKLVATASAEDDARLWEVATGKEASPPLTHKRAVNRVVFSPDGRRVATCSDDKTARVWDAVTGQPVTDPIREAGAIHTVRFSPDGQWILTGGDDNTARVCDASSGRLLFPPLWHSGAVRQARFSADGQRIVTASDDSTAVVWDTRTGVALTPALAHRGWGRITDASFRPDGRRVLTAGAGGTACIWDFGHEDRPAEDLERLAQLLSGNRIDKDTASLVPLDADALQRVWEELRAKYPDEFGAAR